MALIQSTAIPSGATDYELEQSLKFNDDDSAYLSWTPASASNQKTWTWSGWVKRGNLDTEQVIFGGGTSGTNNCLIRFNSDNTLRFHNYVSSFQWNLTTTAVYRDTSSWYNIIAVADTSNGTSGDRVRLYVNGQRITAFGTETYPSQNYDGLINSSIEHTLAKYPSASSYQDGYLAEVNFIDGQALTPSSFGETGDYGEWKPVEYSGTYGNNGFYLPFKQDYTVEGFSTVTYRGNNVSRYIGGVGFQPDLVWLKNRTDAASHGLIDSIRGVTNILKSNSTAAPVTSSAGTDLTGFATDGFTLGATNQIDTNTSGQSFVAWNWDMGGSNATNTDGTITSTVRANPTYGQSIVSYSGATNATVDSSNNSGNYWTIGHGLSEAPELIIAKNRGSGGWYVGSDSLGSTPWTSGSHLVLNSTAATANNANLLWGNAAPNSSTFKVGGWDVVNRNGNDYIAYCFHSVTGYSKFGTWTGNGSATGPSVTTGFKPAFILWKNTENTNHWGILDTTRSPTNPADESLYPNLSNAEGTNDADRRIDFNDTGFQIKSAHDEINRSGHTFIYMTFADKREYAYWLDQSGNNNDWTSNNLTESDISVDSPTNNFATWNPLHNGDTATFAEGNLKLTTGTSTTEGYYSTMAMPETGKWYAEFLVGYTGGWSMFGIASNVYNNSSSGFRQGTSYSYSLGQGNFWINGSSQGASSPSVSWTAGDVVSVAVDLDNNKWYIAKNNTWYQSANPSSGSNGITIANDTYHFGYTFDHDEVAGITTANFGQDSSFAGNKTAQGNQDGNDIGDFYYTPPTGFLALCTKNLPDVAVVPSEHFDVRLRTGTGSEVTVSDLAFQPDLLWTKTRSNAVNHNLHFSLMAQNYSFLQPNTTNAENSSASTYYMTPTSTGYTVGTGDNINQNTYTFVDWLWKAGGGSGSSNSNGSITSTVSANVDAGLSISTFNASGSAATVGHGLNQAPEMVIIKQRNGDGYQWPIYHKDIGNTKYIFLQRTIAAATDSNAWNNTSPTSTVVHLGGSGADTNNTSGQNVMYCFHSVDGYSKVGKLHGNANDDGTFVYTGFKPKMVMWKNADASANWYIQDAARDDDNPVKNFLLANSSAAENNNSGIVDFTANGFKYRLANNANWNTDYDYIFIAFAETPFKYSNAR